ncbi:DEAD/DEAH box helicase family protein [Persephonella atlantica]|nr:DEAD/DEAH box helicase family protein [Persephonella atlantica]
MGLTKYNLPPFMNTSDNNLVEDFYIPLLKESIEYRRGVGFFSSGWFRMVSKGVIYLVENGGRLKIITSPILSKEDYEALITGSKARQDETLYISISNSIQDFRKSLEEDTLSAIAWMIADEILEIKFAVPRNKLTGDFHDKFGIFIDAEGNKVAFSGSPNESIQGFQNYESIKIFPSWRDPISQEIAEAEYNRFETLWYDEDPNLKVFSIPEAAKEEILKLRTKERPYKKEVILKAFKENKFPTPRNYQKEAVENWIKNGYKGLFEMATGTGKTLTSIFAINEYIKKKENVFIVVLVPFIHLVDQWEKDLKLLSENIVKCYGNKKNWLFDLKSKIILQNKNKIKNLIVISTIQTATKEEFIEAIHKSTVPNMIVVDECHYAGAPKYSKVLDPLFEARIGLSATPIRMWDEVGNIKIEDFFSKTVFKFPLEKAIKEGYLTPYEYHPILVELTDEEFREYEKYSEKLAKILSNDKLTDEEKEKKIERILIERANILNKARNKLFELNKLIKQFNSLKYSLFYCAPSQIEVVFDILRNENIVVSKFTAQESNEERKLILDKFTRGEIEAIVAMKCLDEGVDVPATKYAFLLASSTNTRQFIQRRGRILRKYPGKEKAFVYDFIAIPPIEVKITSHTRQIMRRELQRFREFADYALNKYQAKGKILEIARRYYLLDEV